MPRPVVVLRRYPPPCTMPVSSRLCTKSDCRYHLRGKRRRAAKPPLIPATELPTTCALDVARCGQWTMATVGALLGVTRQRIAQIEHAAFERLRRHTKGLRRA